MHQDATQKDANGNEETVKEGQVHYCPMNHSHYMENISNEDVEYLAIVPEHH
jgi:quercetin dioxygenase-like cupin family protein